MTIRELLRNHKKGVGVTLGLAALEYAAWVVEPTIFGLLIDAFIEKAGSKSYVALLQELPPLFFWISIYGINSAAGSARRLLEPRVFQRMLTEIAEQLSAAGNRLGIEASRIAARVQLSEQLIAFLQYRVPELLEHTIAVGGALIALSLYDWRIALTCLFITIPLMFMSRIYNIRVSAIQKDLHDKYEGVYDAFASKDPGVVKNLYNGMVTDQRKIAKWSALNFGSLRFVLLIIFLAVLYISIDIDNFTTGNIFAIVSYLWSFIGSVEYLPELMESRTSLRDITGRLTFGDAQWD